MKVDMSVRIAFSKSWLLGIRQFARELIGVILLLVLVAVPALPNYSVYPILDADKVKVQVLMRGLIEAAFILDNPWPLTEQVIFDAGAAGIDVETYERKFNENSPWPNAYRDSIACEIRAHALGYWIETAADLLLHQKEYFWRFFPILREIGKIMGLWVPGDINLDGIVDLTDQAMLGAAWGSKIGDTNWNADADIVENGIIDLRDLGRLGQNWLKSRKHSNPIDIEMDPDDRDWYWSLPLGD